MVIQGAGVVGALDLAGGAVWLSLKPDSSSSSRSTWSRISAAAARDCSTIEALCWVMLSRSETAVLTWPMPILCSLVPALISLITSLTC